MFKEFKEFAVKGNVVDMAVGIMIGAAFTTVVKSLVDDVLMPPIALATGGLDFTDKFIVLEAGDVGGPYMSLEAAKEAGAVVLRYGQFLNNIISFLIVALVLFFLIRWINRLRRPDTPPAPGTKPCPYCKSSVDLKATRCAFCTSELTADEEPATA